MNLYLPKSEMGQGVHTALAQIAAEELEIGLEQMQVMHAATDRLVDPVATSASNSISGLYTPLREVAATLRELLRAEAARQLNAQPEDLNLENGVFSLKADPTQQRTYGELFQFAGEWELPENPPALKPPSQYRIIGQPLPRVDLPAKITGQAVFGFDVRVPGMLYGAVARPETIEGKLKAGQPRPGCQPTRRGEGGGGARLCRRCRRVPRAGLPGPGDKWNWNGMQAGCGSRKKSRPWSQLEKAGVW